MAEVTLAEPAWGAFPLSASQSLLLTLYRLAPFGRSRLRNATLGWLERHPSPGYDIEVSGIRTRCHLGDNASERKLLLNGARKDRTQLAIVLSRLERGGVFVDIGANVGLYALQAARRTGPCGRVLAIEPNRSMVHRLRFNLASNRFSNVIVEEVAIGENAGTATLSFDPAQQGAGTLASALPGSSQLVSILPLHELAARHAIERISMLKIDIEGYEDRALLPFFDTAPKQLWPRAILMEISWRKRWRHDCVARLRQLGYLVFWQGRDDIALEFQPAP
jgi:FkbM family methyltransferase